MAEDQVFVTTAVVEAEVESNLVVEIPAGVRLVRGAEAPSGFSYAVLEEIPGVVPAGGKVFISRDFNDRLNPE